MDIETAKYITTFFSQFFTDEERIAQRHIHSTIKIEDLDGEKFDRFEKVYKKANWLTEWQPALDLIKDGEEAFVINTAERIMRENSNDIFLNLCPKCHKLARTPYAKQCRHCGYDWH
ncbi:MAG: hypothetical protein E6767_11755 [Dysgonomonas sp.]|nr:hypothetical protein [Dysgonomonas sp.]